MQEVGTLLEVFQRYFAQDIVFVVIIAALPWLVKEFSKSQKLFLSGIIFGILLLFNTLTFWVMKVVGEGETYYRFLWALPCGCIVAVLAIKIWEQLQEKWQKAALLIVCGVAAFLNSSVNPGEWAPRDLHYLSEETMLIADMIEMDSDNKVLVNLYDYSDAIYGIRQYDGNLVLVDDGVEDVLKSVFAQNDGHVAGRIVSSTIVNSQIEYVYIEKEKENAQMALLAGGAVYVGETNEHRIYRFDLTEQEVIYNAARVGFGDIRLHGVEYAAISEVSAPINFIFFADGSVTLLNEKYEMTDIGFKNENEWQELELAEFYICSVDNSDGAISKDTLEQFEKISEQEKPIVLLLAKPLDDGQMELDAISDQNLQRLQQLILAEDTNVCTIFSRGYVTNWRSKLENGIVQCVCISEEIPKNTLVTIKGE